MNLPDFLVEVSGDLRLAGYPVSLYHVVFCYNEGHSPKELHEEFPSVPQDLLHTVIDFYRQNKPEVDAFVARYEAELERRLSATQPGFDWQEVRRRRPDLAYLASGAPLPKLSVPLPNFLTEAPYGEILLTGHRIGLYHLVSHYQAGYTADMLHEQFPTLCLGLIGKVLAFYEENKAEVDAYVTAERADLDRQRAYLPTRLDLEELLRRRPDLARLRKS
jgi:uncharacterized protein (DUF433 family)